MCTCLSAQGGREAIVKSQQSVGLHHMDGHPHHPPLHLLLRLQVHLGREPCVNVGVTFNRKSSPILNDLQTKKIRNNESVSSMSAIKVACQSVAEPFEIGRL